MSLRNRSASVHLEKRRAQKRIINWRGSRLLYIFRVLVGKDIVKIGIDWDALILFQSDEIETESTRRPL